MKPKRWKVWTPRPRVFGIHDDALGYANRYWLKTGIFVAVTEVQPAQRNAPWETVGRTLGWIHHPGNYKQSMQRFIARERYAFANGAIGWGPGGPMDCLGPFAKVQNVPVHGTEWRLTAYAQGYADTAFSIPAATRKNGKTIKGYFTDDGDGGCVFRPYKGELDKVPR